MAGIGGMKPLYQVNKRYLLLYLRFLLAGSPTLYCHWRSPMPRRKPKITELPDKEAIKKLFPKEVIEMADKVAHEKDPKPDDSRKSS
jgi:hypothetical protein